MNTKICKECNLEKPVSEFSKRGGGRDGLAGDIQAMCRSCNVGRIQRYRRSTREVVSRWKLRKGCAHCDFKAQHPGQLDLDHIDPSTKTQTGNSRAYDPSWSRKRLKAELSKCQVLCKNCHVLKTIKEREWKNHTHNTYDNI